MAPEPQTRNAVTNTDVTRDDPVSSAVTNASRNAVSHPVGNAAPARPDPLELADARSTGAREESNPDPPAAEAARQLLTAFADTQNIEPDPSFLNGHQAAAINVMVRLMEPLDVILIEFVPWAIDKGCYSPNGLPSFAGEWATTRTRASPNHMPCGPDDDGCGGRTWITTDDGNSWPCPNVAKPGNLRGLVHRLSAPDCGTRAHATWESAARRVASQPSSGFVVSSASSSAAHCASKLAASPRLIASVETSARPEPGLTLT